MAASAVAAARRYVGELRQFANCQGHQQNNAVPADTRAALQTLRMRYNVVLTAHQNSLRALTEANMSGAPTPELVAKEAQARETLAETRAALRAAISASEQEPV